MITQVFCTREKRDHGLHSYYRILFASDTNLSSETIRPFLPWCNVIMNMDRNTIIASSVIMALIGGFAYFFLFKSESRSIGSFIGLSVIILLLGYGIYFIYAGVTGDSSQSSNLASTPVDASSSTVVPGSKAPPQKGKEGGDYGIQWWMFIKDWDYKFGQEKPVIRRGEKNSYNPYIYLNPTENTLNVKISVFPPDGNTSVAPVGADGSATDDSFTCSVPNVPLQKWTCVGISVSGRNLDIYMDGLLVRSCLLPGVPRPAVGSLEIMPSGGFSGSVIDMYHYSRSLVPADVKTFCSKGTKGTSYNSLPSKSLFGYTVKLGVVDDSGKEIEEYAF